MTAPQLFPRQRRRLKQPTKDVLRKTLAEAADTIARQRREIERLRWWRRLAFWRKS